MAGEAESFILLILALIFPPAAVAIVTGCGPDLILNLLLTLIGWLPGCIHAFWLIFRRSEANEKYGLKQWTYSGMGEYRPLDANAAAGKQQPQPPTGAQGQAPPPPGPLPADQKQAPSPAAEEQKQGEKSTPQDNQKAIQVASSQSESDQKVADPVPEYTPVASSST